MEKVFSLQMKLFLALVIIACSHGVEGGFEDGGLVNLKKLEMFVDDLPNMPKIRGYNIKDGKQVSRTLTIGMFEKKWRFHRDLPLTPVFAYGTSRKTATIPGPTIEALSGIATRVEWQNNLPSKHILPWDPTIPTAVAPPTTGGIPTVVHLHGAIADPTSDGNSQAWFTSDFNSTGPNWSLKIYNYPNVQVPGNLWYHDHAMGLTRVNILAGLVGAYVVRDRKVEAPLGLPSGSFDRNLVVFDRSFRSDGSIYMNSTGDNPAIHPQWQPEYFGDAIVVNGKAWPKLRVKRRKYRFRILNASNARYFRFLFADQTGLTFIHVGSDSVYLPRRVRTTQFVVSPSEFVDIVVDFSKSKSSEAILLNGAPYPYPSGVPTDELNGKVMKFLIEPQRIMDKSSVPNTLLRYPKPNLNEVVNKRFITMSEYTSATDEPVHLYLNGKPFDAPVTEIPRVGTSEEWEVINLTEDNHPFHLHLGLFAVLQQRRLSHVEDIQECVTRHSDPLKCHVESYKRGKLRVMKHERGWKNVYQMRPGYATQILVRFAMLVPDPNSSYSYPFDASSEPGYVYHCHILDHEDNEMMRPFKMTN